MSTSPELVKLAEQALRLQLKADEATAAATEAKDALYARLEEEHMLNQDTKGVGDLVRLSISPNRKFSVEKAEKLVTKKVLKECEVTKVDPTLLKRHLTPIQLEEAMEFYPRAWKLSLKIAD